MKLAIVWWLEVQSIDSKIVAAVDNAVERLFVGEIERRSGDEEQERQ